MKREDLEKLGLNEEQITGVMKLKSSSITDNQKELDDLKKNVTDLTATNTNLQKQIDDANKEIQSYKDMDIDSIKKSASEWEDKYNKLIESQENAKKEELNTQRVNKFFENVKFSSDSAKEGIISKFNKKEFKYDETSEKFQGATEWLEEMKKEDAGAFLSEKANPKFSTSITEPTKGVSEVSDGKVSLSSRFRNF